MGFACGREHTAAYSATEQPQKKKLASVNPTIDKTQSENQIAS